jgi:2'-5' RNA ligase
MPEQLSLTGFEGPRRPTDRLFLAISPTPNAAMLMTSLAQRFRSEHDLKGASLAMERLHITLHHLGDYEGLPRGVVAAAAEAASTIAVAPFDVAFDRVLSFSGGPRKQPFVLSGGSGLGALKAFRQALGVAMTRTGLGRWAQPAYTPHVTLLYDDSSVAEQTVETIGWTVREFILVHSLLGKSRHIRLGQWSLQPL